MAIEVERTILGISVTRVLDRLALSRVLRQVARTDNGKGFCDKAIVTWACNTRGASASDPAGQTEPTRLRCSERSSPAAAYDISARVDP